MVKEIEMKEIKAFIKKSKLSDVIWALHEIKGLTGVTMAEVFGYGREKARGCKDKMTFVSVECVPRIKLEIMCRDNLVNSIVSIIQKAAHTGLHGDGKIYVSAINKAVRISTNERGEKAV